MKKVLIGLCLFFVLVGLAHAAQPVSIRHITQTIASASNNQEVVSVPSTLKLLVYGFSVFSASANTVTLHFEASAAAANILLKAEFTANSGYAQDYPKGVWPIGNPGQDLDVDASGSGNIYITVYYDLIPLR